MEWRSKRRKLERAGTGLDVVSVLVVDLAEAEAALAEAQKELSVMTQQWQELGEKYSEAQAEVVRLKADLAVATSNWHALERMREPARPDADVMAPFRKAVEKAYKRRRSK